MTKVKRLATLLILGVITLTGKTMVVQAEEMPMAGIAVVLNDFYDNAESTDEKVVNNLLQDLINQKKLSFAQVTDYANIWNEASEEGEVIGKLYDNAAATILDQKGAWYKIKSGSVTGYIQSKYLVTGEKALNIAKKVGTRVAVVNTKALKVREKASTNSAVVALIAKGDDLKVTKELKGWAKVQLDENTYGYVSTDFVKLQTSYEEAVSIEEEIQRLEEEAISFEEERQTQAADSVEAEIKRMEALAVSLEKERLRQLEIAGNQSQNNTNSGNSSATKQTTGSNSDLGSKIVAYAVQFLGNPYVWGGTSLTNGADCSGFTQAIFKKFGISIPRTSRVQATGGTRVSLDNMIAGDLIFYAKDGVINHVGIYMGNGKVISASSPSTGIRISDFDYRTPVKAVRYL